MYNLFYIINHKITEKCKILDYIKTNLLKCRSAILNRNNFCVTNYIRDSKSHCDKLFKLCNTINYRLEIVISEYYNYNESF